MDFEHIYQSSNYYLLFQMLFLGSLMIPGLIGRQDLYGKTVRTLASNVVSFGPMAILLYVLYEVSYLQ